MTVEVGGKPVPVASPQSAAYWAACAQHRLELQRCAECASAIFPPRRWCPACGSAELGAEVASGRGTVYSFSVVHQAPIESYRADAPYVLALVELDEGPRMMTNIVDADPAAVTIGARVGVTFERRGADRWIPQFRLQEEQA